MPRTRLQEAAAARRDDAESTNLINNIIHSKPNQRRVTVALKQAPTVGRYRQLVSVEQESDADSEEEENVEEEEEEDVEEALNAQLLANQSGFEPEDMTDELENHQRKSLSASKSTEKHPQKQLRRPSRKGKGTAEDIPEPPNVSPRKRKRDDEIFNYSIPEDEGDAQDNHQLTPFKRPSKRPKTKDILKQKSYTIVSKRGRGRPRKNSVYKEPIFQNEPVAPANNESDNGGENSDATFSDPANNSKTVPRNARRAEEVDEEEEEEGDALNGPTSAQQRGEDDNDDAEDGDEDGITGLIMSQSPVKSPARAKLPASRKHHLRSAEKARKISSNHAKSIHNNRTPSPLHSRRREKIPAEVGEELRQAAEDIADEAEEEADDNTDFREGSDRQLSRKLTLWKGIIGLDFFRNVERISKRFGCKETNGIWETVTSESRGVKTKSGERIERSLKELQEHYRDLKYAMDEKNDVDQIQANLDIDRSIDALKHRINNLLEPLYEDVVEHYENRRREFLVDLYFVLIRKFLKVLKTAILTYGSYEPLSKKDLSVVIEITKIILGLFNNLDRQNKEFQPVDRGQTKQPLRELRHLLRVKLLQNCQQRLRDREDEEMREKLLASTQEKIRAEQEEDETRKIEKEERDREIRAYNKGVERRMMNDPEKARLIKLEMKRNEYRKLPQAERIRRELEAERAKKATRPMQQITQEEREEYITISHGSRRIDDWDDWDDQRNDPFLEDYVPPHDANSNSIFAQFQRRDSTSPLLPEPEREPEPEPELEPEPEPEPKAPPSFDDVPDEEKERFYAYFRAKYEYEKHGLEDKDFWNRLRADLDGGRYTLDEIWEFAKELQASLDDAHENRELDGDEYLWTYHVWDWDRE
ncbi:hypothetical protein sscle_15g103260 [Sclerotinia sclerotiorum 1980 UF-70]|uniref:Uncharacterized protein n=1 Tax=Sclerotinia sclerotiorum (strain ATCC 18683 / 1980 / Ss-1) TaxID=665079 RepID=A0A1D9QKV0_SCLS1|nr:hypothetical protein sscle_15g103260 [Sclerotinia sclerotiorum 1980 UF-70]